MTAVAFEDETGYSKYSAVHVLGMILLGLAILILIVGIVLSISFKSRIAPDDFSQEMSTTHGKIRLKVDLDTVCMQNSIECLNKDSDLPLAFHPNKQHVNYFVEKDYSTTTAGHADNFNNCSHKVSKACQKGYQEQSTSINSLVDNSSSFSSSESDDCTSGSYTITDDVVEDQPRHLFPFQFNRVENNHHSLNSESMQIQEQKPSFRNIKTIVVGSSYTTLNNFFQYSTHDDSAIEYKECHENSKTICLQNSAVLVKDNESKNNEKTFYEKINDQHRTQTSQSTKHTPEIDIQENRYGSRQRLNGFSSDSVLNSPKIYNSLEIIVVPIETQHSTSYDNASDRYASVFSVTMESRTRGNKMRNKKSNNGNSLRSLNLNRRRSLSRSPYATRPYSLPDGHKMFGSSGAKVLRQSSGETLNVKPNSSEVYIRFDKKMVSMTSYDRPTSTPV